MMSLYLLSGGKVVSKHGKHCIEHLLLQGRKKEFFKGE